MNRADALAESLLESGITAMKIWPFDPAARRTTGLYISRGADEGGARAVREDPQGGRRQDGDHGRVPLAVEPADGQEDRPRRSSPTTPTWYEDPIRMNSPQALAEYARSTDVWVCASETLGLALSLQGHARPRRDARRHGRPVLDRRPDRGAQDRRDGGDLPPPLRAARLHRPGRLHRRHPRLVQPAQHADPGDACAPSTPAGTRNSSPTMPVIKDGYVYRWKGPGWASNLLPAVFERSDLTVRRSEA